MEPDQIDMMDDAELRAELRKSAIEIVKLREELEEARTVATSMTNEAIRHKQRAETAEAKLKGE